MRKPKLMIIASLVALLAAFSLPGPAFADIECPDGTVNAKKTMANLTECNTVQDDSLFPTINNVINVALSLVALVSVVMIIVGGYQYATSAGDTAKVTKAKNTIIYSIVGLAIALLSYAIVNFVISDALGGATGDGGESSSADADSDSAGTAQKSSTANGEKVSGNIDECRKLMDANNGKTTTTYLWSNDSKECFKLENKLNDGLKKGDEGYVVTTFSNECESAKLKENGFPVDTGLFYKWVDGKGCVTYKKQGGTLRPGENYGTTDTSHSASYYKTQVECIKAGQLWRIRTGDEKCLTRSKYPSSNYDDNQAKCAIFANYLYDEELKICKDITGDWQDYYNNK